MSDLKVRPPREKSRFLTPPKYGGCGMTAKSEERSPAARSPVLRPPLRNGEGKSGSRRGRAGDAGGDEGNGRYGSL